MIHSCEEFLKTSCMADGVPVRVVARDADVVATAGIRNAKRNGVTRCSIQLDAEKIVGFVAWCSPI